MNEQWIIRKVVQKHDFDRGWDHCVFFSGGKEYSVFAHQAVKYISREVAFIALDQIWAEDGYNLSMFVERYR